MKFYNHNRVKKTWNKVKHRQDYLGFAVKMVRSWYTQDFRDLSGRWYMDSDYVYFEDAAYATMFMLKWA
jgi:hypothetical protein